MADKPVIKKGLPPWMATFSDMCTLLLTFFVLLLTFANLDLQKFKDTLGSVRMAFGVQMEQVGQFQAIQANKPAESTPYRYQTMPNASMDDTARQEALAEEMASQVRTMVNDAKLGDQVEISSGPDGVRMRVKGQLLFDAAQADVRQRAERLLKGVAEVMRRYQFYLTLEGHTDSVPIKTSQFPSNWELSASRAAAVLRTLVSLGVPADRMAAVGYADNYPIASNSSDGGRGKNRRVEFVFTKDPLRGNTKKR
ncbi:MAG: OmpA family protein [Deltaproteobacteria bacterium]|nr:OmpA family protein [Deltaproteobacteria bacterium]